MWASLLTLACSVSMALALKSSSDPRKACECLNSTFPNHTLFPTDDRYTNETQVSWNAAAWLQPACIFLPSDANQLSFAVTLFKQTQTPFAMRGGGHMPTKDAANIGPHGVLISSTNLNALSLSNDSETLTVGPGNRWADVYGMLNGTDLAVFGGRIGAVGVPGLLLGGGVSFYSFNLGIASTGGKINGYECVLANGSIVTATAKEHSDLYWALQGGANSFALVTKFYLQTYYGPPPLIAGNAAYNNDTTKEAFLDAVHAFAADDESDPYAAITPLARWQANYTKPSYLATLFYNGTSIPSTGPFTAFVNDTAATLKASDGSSHLQRISMATYGAAVRPEFERGGPSFGSRQKFHVVSSRATREAIEIIHDTYFDALQRSGLPDSVEGFLTDVAFNPMTRRSVNSHDSPLDIPQEATFWAELDMTWKNEEDDEAIDRFIRSVDAEIKRKLRAIDASLPFLYIGDADGDQPIFEGYGKKSLRKLKTIRQRYDPERVFTDLMPGGFKVAHAKLHH